VGAAMAGITLYKSSEPCSKQSTLVSDIVLLTSQKKSVEYGPT
jgi:hypothetical protein